MKNIRYIFVLLLMQFYFMTFAMDGITVEPGQQTVNVSIMQSRNIDQLYDALPANMRSKIGKKDLGYILSDVETLDFWQIREILIQTIDPTGPHRYWNFLRAVRKIVNIGGWIADLGIAAFSPFVLGFPDVLSQRVTAGIMSGLGIGTIVFAIIKKSLESEIKEEGKKILFKTFHPSLPFVTEDHSASSMV